MPYKGDQKGHRLHNHFTHTFSKPYTSHAPEMIQTKLIAGREVFIM